MQPVTVFQTFDPAEAQCIRATLEAAGFTAVVNHEDVAVFTIGSAVTASGTLVQVPDAEAAEARDFLATPAKVLA